jgi:hypothetical protein
MLTPVKMDFKGDIASRLTVIYKLLLKVVVLRRRPFKALLKIEFGKI